MVELRVVGAAPGGEVIDATARLGDVPRVGDSLAVWTGREEVYVEVSMITWPTWSYDHLPEDDQAPDVYLMRPDDISDQEWAGVFVAIRERRSP